MSTTAMTLDTFSARLAAEAELAGLLQIRSIPTLMIFRDGVPLFSQAGVLPAAALDDLVTQARAVDMEEVQRQVAQSKVA